MPAENWPAAETAAPTSAAVPDGAPGMADYDAISAAVMATDRGRWFLAEYARRNRHADTAEVLAAIEHLAATARPVALADRNSAGDAGAAIDRLRAELADMANAIARAKSEIASIRPDAAQGGRILEATEQLDSVMRTTERATSDILAAAEQVQEVAWTMREQGMESEFCDRLDGYATAIYTACSFQDLTGQRTRKIIHVLRYLEARIEAMSGMWGAATHAAPSAAAASVPGPAAPSDDLVQDDVDRMMAPPAPPVAATEAEALAVEAPSVEAVAVETPVAKATADASATVSSLSAAATVDEAKPALSIEGPAGSFSILARADAPEEQQTVAMPATPLPFEADAAVADLRAFAADLMAEFRGDPEDPQDALPAPTPATPPAAPAAITPEATPVITAPVAAEEPPSRQDDSVLPLAAAPPLGEPLPAPEPALEPVPEPPRKPDIAEDLFADVMALTDEERIALFT
jgi:chemotaxis regulatin CheY-phosphate phosphatase CheZ